MRSCTEMIKISKLWRISWGLQKVFHKWPFIFGGQMNEWFLQVDSGSSMTSWKSFLSLNHFVLRHLTTKTRFLVTKTFYFRGQFSFPTIKKHTRTETSKPKINLLPNACRIICMYVLQKAHNTQCGDLWNFRTFLVPKIKKNWD